MLKILQKPLNLYNNFATAAMKKHFITLFAAILGLCACQQHNYVQISGYAQGGTYSVKCSIPKGSRSNWAAVTKGKIDSILFCIDNSVSGYNKSSLLSRMNAGESITADGSAQYSVLEELTAYCDSLYIATSGALDTRAAALFDVWGFGFKSGDMPTEQEVEAAALDRSRMNFNAVAQGYSADKVASYLKAQGVTDMLVDVGGEMYCSGVNPRGNGWTIGIDAPIDGNMTPGANMQGTFTIPEGLECGIVTSGNYRKFYIKDGVKYSHTIDPRTKAPVRHNLLSSTIIAPSSALADALATYCMVIGMEEARAFIESRPDLEACLISSDEVWCSEGFGMN